MKRNIIIFVILFITLIVLYKIIQFYNNSNVNEFVGEKHCLFCADLENLEMQNKQDNVVGKITMVNQKIVFTEYPTNTIYNLYFCDATCDDNLNKFIVQNYNDAKEYKQDLWLLLSGKKEIDILQFELLNFVVLDKLEAKNYYNKYIKKTATNKGFASGGLKCKVQQQFFN